ncbi:unnamed protein product, partial [Coregonus sp. 'balchen']
MLVLECSFYCGLIRTYAGTAANSVLLNTASHPGISLLLLSKFHSPRCFELQFSLPFVKIVFQMDKPLLCVSPEKSSGH